MGWQQHRLSKLLMSLSLWLVACGGGISSNSTSVSGVIKSFFNAELPTQITIAVAGRDNDLFTTADLTSGSSETGFNYSLANVPSGEAMVFRLSGGGVEPAISFPLLPGALPTTLAFVGPNNYTNFKMNSQTQLTSRGVTINQNLGIILGSVSTAMRSLVRQVEIHDGVGNIPSSIKGPYYLVRANINVGFELSTQNVLDSSTGLYVFFNVPAGNYILTYLGDGNLLAAVDVAAIAPGLMLGAEIP